MSKFSCLSTTPLYKSHRVGLLFKITLFAWSAGLDLNVSPPPLAHWAHEFLVVVEIPWRCDDFSESVGGRGGDPVAALEHLLAHGSAQDAGVGSRVGEQGRKRMRMLRPSAGQEQPKQNK